LTGTAGEPGPDRIMHLALFKWTAGVSADRVAEITDALRAMAVALPQIHTYRCGADLAIRDGSWDFAVVAVVASADDLDAYLGHDMHVEIVERLVRPVLADRVAVQLALPGGGSL
jgi:hypothetical protein